MRPSIVIITGLSGSGKTVALRAIEDSGFTCVDNLPPQLIDAFASTLAEKGGVDGIAVGMDIRGKEFLRDMNAALKTLREKYDLSILFLEAEVDILVRRFRETRRPHPLMSSGMSEIREAIEEEKGLLLPLREEADRIVDTSPFTPHQLRRQIISLYGGGETSDPLHVALMSFGFKYGAPVNVDMLFDVRFLPNPHFVPELRELSGLDGPVREFVLNREETTGFLQRLMGLMDFLIPLFRKEGKAYLTIGVGCTGGRHRSPVIVEQAASALREGLPNLNVIHRDI